MSVIGVLISVVQSNKLICSGWSNVNVFKSFHQRKMPHTFPWRQKIHCRLKKGNVWVNESMREQGGGAGQEDWGHVKVGRV